MTLEPISKIVDHVSRVPRDFTPDFYELFVFIRARREPTEKRSIHGVCEHFEEARNKAIGR